MRRTGLYFTGIIDDEYEGKEEIWETAQKSMIKCPVSFQVHIVVAAIFCLGSLIVFHWISVPLTLPFWWWIFFFVLFGMTLPLHYYFYQDKFWKGIVAAALVFNFGLVIIWSLAFQTSGCVGCQTPLNYPWWIFSFLGTGLIGVPIYYLKVAPRENKFTFLFILYCILNIFSFCFWFFSFRTLYPWFIFPLFLLAMPLVFYRMWYNMKMNSHLYPHIYVQLTLLNLFFYFVWAGFHPVFPFYLIIFFISVVIAVITFFLRNKIVINRVSTNQ